jgi:hypothetical protein
VLGRWVVVGRAAVDDSRRVIAACGAMLAWAPGSVTLAVADTLAGYDVVGPTGSAEAVAGRGLRTWTVVLRAQPSSGPWRIASINAS